MQRFHTESSVASRSCQYGCQADCHIFIPSAHVMIKVMMPWNKKMRQTYPGSQKSRNGALPGWVGVGGGRVVYKGKRKAAITGLLKVASFLILKELWPAGAVSHTHLSPYPSPTQCQSDHAS